MEKKLDILGQEINEGDILVWTRGTKPAWTCVGVIDSISDKGAIYAKIIRSGKHCYEEGLLVRLGRTNSCVVLNDKTSKQLLLYKMKQ